MRADKTGAPGNNNIELGGARHCKLLRAFMTATNRLNLGAFCKGTNTYCATLFLSGIERSLGRDGQAAMCGERIARRTGCWHHAAASALTFTFGLRSASCIYRSNSNAR